LKIQRELCHPKYAQKVSGLSRNRPPEKEIGNKINMRNLINIFK